MMMRNAPVRETEQKDDGDVIASNNRVCLKNVDFKVAN